MQPDARWDIEAVSSNLVRELFFLALLPNSRIYITALARQFHCMLLHDIACYCMILHVIA